LSSGKWQLVAKLRYCFDSYFSHFLRASCVPIEYREAMPNLTVAHEAPLELIKQHPALAIDLFQAMTGTPLADGLDVRLGTTSLNEVVPVEFRVDTTVVVSDPVTREPVLVILIEPQGRDDKTKKFSWPAYIAVARKAVNCDKAVLIVVCPDPAEAEKCRRDIPTGHPGWDLRPIVIDPGHAPGDEGADPYLLLFLACLRVLDMETEAGARRVLSAILDTGASHDEQKILTTIILVRASEGARRLLEDMMVTMEWKSDFIESFVEQGLEQGLEQGRVEAKREVVLKALDLRRLQPTEEQRARVDASTDLAQLDRWFERSQTAISADEVFSD
jgi:hypothetical protein